MYFWCNFEVVFGSILNVKLIIQFHNSWISKCSDQCVQAGKPGIPSSILRNDIFFSILSYTKLQNRQEKCKTEPLLTSHDYVQWDIIIYWISSQTLWNFTFVFILVFIMTFIFAHNMPAEFRPQQTQLLLKRGWANNAWN